jgi:ATP-binding cassette, subfamily C (CFTR/MRP), member 1
MSILDFDIPYSMSFVIAGCIEVSMAIIVMSTVTWQVLIIAFPVIIIVMKVQVSFQSYFIYILELLL